VTAVLDLRIEWRQNSCLNRSSKMRTTLVLDDDLLARAREYTGLTEKSAIVRAGLVALVEREAARRLARMGGTDLHAKAAPRRRPPYA
jgi:Arc/MetJ family transcription regulator